MLYLDKLFIILMKKLLYAAMLLLGVGIMAVSCKKDDGISTKEYANAIVGEWKLNKMEFYENGKLKGTQTATDKENAVLIFTDTGKVTTIETDDGKTHTYVYDYTVVDNYLYLDGDKCLIKKMTKRELVLSFTYDDEEERAYLTRVK